MIVYLQSPLSHMQRDCGLGRAKLALGSAALLAGAVATALAQESSDDVRSAITIEVTGSNIPRPEAEAALPVQIMTRDDIVRSGATTTSELMSRVSANVLGFNDQLSIGDAVRPGLSSANLRGIGDGSTLVLLNGRRVANYAFDGGTVDINSIPLSAIDRVEILKDGASAIYGTDAIAGVVNFILRKDFRGVEATGYGAWTEHGGGDGREASVSAGHGDLLRDRFNVFATMSYQKNDALHAIDRSFSRTGYIPSEGMTLLSGASFPANIQVHPGVLVSPAFTAGCAPPASIPIQVTFLSRASFCGYDFTSTIDIVPATERTSVVGRGTLQVNNDNQLFVEANYAYNRFTFRNAPTSIFQGAGESSQPVLYPAGGPYYPAAFAAANGVAGDLNLRFRTAQLGPQTNATDSKAVRVVVGAEGSAWSWRYSTAVAYSENWQNDRFVSGYVSQARFLPALATGLINPFGPSGPDGDALLASTQIVGDTHDGEGATLDVDVKASKDIYELAEGSLAIALGAEARHERLDNAYSPVWTSGDVLGVGGSQRSASGGRNVGALFFEASVSLASGFDAQIAARYDHYGDFGGTSNPKVALRWQPTRTLLLRTSWGTGFRAPTLYDLFTPLSRRAVFGASLQDPIRCPATGLPADCPGAFGGAFTSASGGNPSLHPEKSEQFGAGVVWEPVPDLSLNVEYWKINKSNVIGTLDPAVVFGNFDRYASSNIIRGHVDPNFPGLPGPIQTVLLDEQNLGDLRTAGIDIAAGWRVRTTPIGSFGFSLDASYVLSWEEQLDGIQYTSALGRKGPDIAGPVPRWRHHAILNWEYGPWGATIAQTFQSGYLDANIDRAGAPLAVPPRSAGSYELWDLQGRYSGLASTAIAFGVKNLLDRAPPFSNQPFTRQVGYDPAYADPLGRTYYVRLTYAFK
jgi:iron complex outermembrane recepter protein